jgi:hypothetical protein
LSGTVAGDYGFDPLKLSEQPQQFDKYFEAELLHARYVAGVAGETTAVRFLLVTDPSTSMLSSVTVISARRDSAAGTGFVQFKMLLGR